MNKRLYRIVFNRARGLFQVTAEIVRRQGQSGSRGHHCGSSASSVVIATCTRLQFALWLALGQVTVVSLAQAQIIADPTAPGNQRPTVLEAANGVPLVNIQTPSAAGVSRNTYQQFDVSAPGAILNNARTSAQTQIGGWVQGNPWLAGGSARVILNEVNSSNPSQLRGMVEVAGQRAEVVIANPAGITCDGCGFINADRTTLTTGAPVMNSGSLEGYRVQGGEITINGKGMDARGSDYTAIIARAVQINAALWAQHLQVNAGAQEVSADHATAKPIATNSKPPEFSLDVSALGGMYAGKIKLIGTEHGVGVRNAGHIGAAVGEVIVTADGRLENAGTLQAKTDTQIAAQSVTNTDGVLYAGRNLEIKAAETVENHGGALLAGGDATITAQHVDNRAAKTTDQTQGIQAERIRITAQGLVRNDGLIDSSKTQIQADTVDNVGTGRIYGNHVAIAAKTVRNREEGKKTAVIAARERLDVGADTLINREHALIFSAGTDKDALNIGSALDANQHATGAATFVRNDSATIESLGGLTINSQSLFNTNQHIETILAQITDPTLYLYIQPKGDPVKHRADEYRWENWSRSGRYRNKQTGQAIEDWTQFNVIETEYETQVTASDPALIRAGKDIILQGENLTNDKSQIIAGGALQGDLDSLNNIDALGEHRIHQEGTSQYTRSRWRGGFKRYHERKWDPVLAYTPADDVHTITLNVVKAEQHVVGSANTHTLDTDGTYHVPANSLYRVNPTAPGYLIETDPRFTNYRQWLSSDYMFDQLRIDPTLVHKRLGDGFYEQQLVRDQIGQLTGRRFLDSYADDEAQYRALLESGVTIAHAWNLRPGIALSAEQMAQLTSDIVWLVERQVTLPDGTTTVALVPQVYVRPRAGDLDGRGTLLAADRVEFNLTGDLSNGGTIAGRTVVRLTVENLYNLGGRITGDNVAFAARNDINNIGGTLSATSALSLAAGRDLNVTSTTHSDAKTAGLSDFSRTNMDRVAGLYVTGGTLTATAGRDANLIAAQIVNSNPQGQTVITSGRDLNLSTVQIAEQENNVLNANNYLRQGYIQDLGTSIQTAGDVLLQAGNKLTATAATVHSQDGTIAANAAGDITLAAGQVISNWGEGRQHKDRSTLGSKQTTTRDSLNQTQALASTLSGNTVAVQGQNITVSGSNVVSDAGTVLTAQNNLTIQSATETRAETHFKYVKQSGVLYNGGAAVTFGSQMQSLDRQGNNATAAASTIGSTQGDVNLTAGNTYQQTGSHIKAAEGDIDIHAKNVNIVEAREANHSTQEYKFRQSGLTVALSSPVLSAIQTGQQMAQSASQTRDSRMQALAGVTTALAAKNAYDAVQASPDTAGGLNISITLGSSQSQSTARSSIDTAVASTVTAGGDVHIQAAGAGQDSNLTVRGSRIQVDGNVALSADGNLNLLAAHNTAETSRQSKSSSAGVGVAIAVGQNGLAFGVTANGSAARGKGNGSDGWWTNTQVAAGEDLTLNSGADTTLRGAVASGHQVTANIGGNLNLESLQDTSRFNSKDQSIGGGITVGYGFAASAAASQQRIHSDYASVTEQTSIQAGDGGFQIAVKGNTDLKGAAIASTRPAIENDRNQLTTGTLTTSDIENHADYHASSVGVGGGFSVAGSSQADANEAPGKTSTPSGAHWMQMGNGTSITPPVAMSASGDSHSTTKSGISGAHLTITDTQGQPARTGKTAEQTLASLNRNVITGELNANALDTIFNEQEIRAGFEITSAFAQQVGTFLNNRAQESAQAQAALDKELAKPAEERDVSRIAQLQKNIADNAAWAPGGTYRQILTAITAAAGANVSGSAAQFAQAAVVNYVQQQGAAYIGNLVKQGELTEGSPLHASLHAIIACAGVAAANQGCTDGALGAAASSVLTHLFEEKPNETAPEKESKRNLIASLVTGIAAAGGWDGATATSAAIATTDNNYLTARELGDYQLLIWKKCMGAISACVDEAIATASKKSTANDVEMNKNCADSPLSEKCRGAINDATWYVANDTAWNVLKDDVSRSSQNLFNYIYNSKGAKENFILYYDTIDHRYDFFGASNLYEQNLGVGAKWYGGAAEVSGNFPSGLGAGLSSVSFFIGATLSLSPSSVYAWREEAGNLLMTSGFDSFKNLYGGENVDSVLWDINQLKNEQKALQPIHAKYLKDKTSFLTVTKWMNEGVDLLDYKSRITYGCKKLGLTLSQGCVP